MSDTLPTPLSDAISRLLESAEDNAFDSFLEVFRSSQVGVGFPAQHGDTLRLAVVETPDNRRMIKACADPGVFVQRFPGEPKINGLIRGQEILEMVAENASGIDGVLVCSATSFHSVPVSREQTARFAPASTRETEELVTVPAEHKTIVVKPALRPHFARLESGVGIADMGAGSDFEAVLHEAASAVAAEPPNTIIWILHEALLVRMDADGEPLLRRLEPIVRQTKSPGGHCAVLVQKAAERHGLVRRLKELGMGVHGSAEDGACFVEVHRPDGIVVGMPGPAL